MKRTLLIITILTAGISAFAQGIQWKDAKDLKICGKVTPDTYETYSRFPGYLKDTARGSVWSLSRHSPGVYVRFSTDSDDIHIRWSNVFKSGGDNMSLINSRGVDLYVFCDGEWKYLFTGRPRGKEPFTGSVKCDLLPEGNREFMLYLSLYDGVKELEIGVPEGKTISAPAMDSPREEKPVIMYGTSILHGGSSSRPGLASTNILSRKLDRTVINLGFSGNALLDYEVAELMASYEDPGVFVLDNVPNCSAELVTEKQEHFFRILRDAHPDVPVVFVENPIYPRFHYCKEDRDRIAAKNAALKDVYTKLKKQGEKRIYYIEGEGLLGDDREGTIDGTHFTDVGFQRYVSQLYPVLKKLCRKF